jgi:hypothetical protein
MVAFAKSPLTRERTWRKRDTARPEAEGQTSACARRWPRCTICPPPCYTDEQWAALEAITRILPRAVAELRLVFAARNQCDFVEVAQGARARAAAMRRAHGPDARARLSHPPHPRRRIPGYVPRAARAAHAAHRRVGAE